MVGLTYAQKFSFAETIAYFRRTMALLFVLGVLVLPFRAFALEIASVSYFSGYPLESRDILKVLYSPAHNKVFCLHNWSVTILDVSATPLTAKYYTPYARQNAYPILPSGVLFKDMAYDEQNRRLILSFQSTLLIIDEQTNVLLTSFSVQPRVPSSSTGIDNLHVHKNKVYFLISTFTPESQYINVFASYDLFLGQYEEYFNRGPRGNYWDDESQQYVSSANNVSDGLYSDFAFFEEPELDDEYVMLSDIVYGQSLGSLLLGNIRQKIYFDHPENRTAGAESPLDFGPTCDPVRWASFYKYPLEPVSALVDYAVVLPGNNFPDVRVRLSWNIGQAAQDHEPYCRGIPWVNFFVDGVLQGGLTYYYNTSLDKVFHGKSLYSALDYVSGVRFVVSTEGSLSSSLRVSYYPPYTHTKYTTDSTPQFFGGGSKVALMDSDVYFTGFHVEENESYDSQRGRKDVLLLSENILTNKKTLTNLTKKFSLPPNAIYGLTPFGNDMALLAQTYPVVTLYVINKDRGIQLLQPLQLYYNTRSLDGDAEDGLLAAGGQQGLYLIWFKQDKLITEFTVKPDSKIVYPYADGPTGTESEAKVNFTLAKDAKVTLRIEDPAGRIVKTLLEEQLLSTGEYTFEASASKMGNGIVWRGGMDEPLLEQGGSQGRSILIAPDGRYFILLIATDISGNGLPPDLREEVIEIKSQ